MAEPGWRQQLTPVDQAQWKTHLLNEFRPGRLVHTSNPLQALLR